MRQVLIRVGVGGWTLLAALTLGLAMLPPSEHVASEALNELLGSHLAFVAEESLQETTVRGRMSRIDDLTRPLLIRAHVHETQATIPPNHISVSMGNGQWLAARPPPPRPPPWRRLWPPFALLTAVGLTGLFMSRQFFADLGRVEAAVTAIRHEDMSVRIEAVAPSVQPLADAINQLVGRVEGLVGRHAELLQAVSHELRTPLARLELELEALSGDLPEGALAGAHEEMDALERLISELVTWLRAESSATPRAEISLTTCVEAAVQRAAVLAPQMLLTHASSPLGVVVGESDVARILDNGLGNAIRHAVSTIWVAAEVTRNGLLTLEIHDDGPGFTGDPSRLLEPFVKGDRSAGHGGSGLGLSIVHRIALRYQGEVVLARSELLGGACLRVTLETGPVEDS